MKSQKILFCFCLLGSQLLAMEQKPSQALAVKKPGELGALTDANSSHWGFWGKTGAAVGAVGGLATLGIGAGLFFAPKEDRDLGYKDRLTKMLARIGALLRWQAPAVKKDAHVALENTGVLHEGSNGLVRRSVAGGVAATAAASSLSVCAEGKTDLLDEMPTIYQCFTHEDHSINGYALGFAAVMKRAIKQEEVLGLIKNCVTAAENVKDNPYYAKAFVSFSRDLRVLSDPEADAMFRRLAVVGKIDEHARCRHFLEDYREGFSEVMGREIKEEEVLGLLKKCIDNLEDAMRNPHFADAAEMRGLSAPGMLADFQKDLEILSHVTDNPLFDVLKTAQEIYGWVKDGKFTRYGTAFAYLAGKIDKQGHREDMNDGEVLRLLKKCIDDLEVAKRSPYFVAALRMRYLNASLIDDALATFKRDLPALTEAAAKYGAAVLGNAETKGK